MGKVSPAASVPVHGAAVHDRLHAIPPGVGTDATSTSSTSDSQAAQEPYHHLRR